MATALGEMVVTVTPKIEDADNYSALIAGIRLYEALYHAPAEWLLNMPKDVMDRYADMQILLQDGHPVRVTFNSK